MTTNSKSPRRLLAIAIAVLSMLALANGRGLFAQGQSDDLQVSQLGGPVIQNTVIPETVGPGSEPSALFTAPGSGLPAIVGPGGLPGIIPPGVAGAHYVILTEPPGEPPDINELPPVMYQGPNGPPVVVSDLLINTLGANAPPAIALVSDNNPDLMTYVQALPPGMQTTPETGQLQDLTPLMGPNNFPGVGPIDVQVRSDVAVPEPSSIVILLGFVGTGLIGSIWYRRRPSALIFNA